MHAAFQTQAFDLVAINDTGQHDQEMTIGYAREQVVWMHTLPVI